MIFQGKNIVASLLIVISLFFGAPERTYAIPVFDAANTFQQTYGNIISTIGNAYSAITAFTGDALTQKEYIYDNIAYAAISAAREALVRSVIDWVNSGFEGSPAFVQNLQGYLQNVADEIAGEFITGAGLDALCSPFALNIKGALSLEYDKIRTNGERIDRCTFTDITKNIDNFGKSVENSFTAKDFFAYTSNPVNTPQGAYMDAKAKLEVSIVNKKGEEVKILDFGKGFLSKKECANVGGKEVCSVVTPGDTISASLNKSLGLGADSLVTADEMNELVGAFIGYLLRSTLQGGLASANYGESGDIGLIQGLAEFDLTETQYALNEIVKLQKNAVNAFGDVIKKLASQCSSETTNEARMNDYRSHDVYDLYLELVATETRVSEKLDEMQVLDAAMTTATSTIEALALTDQVNDFTQSPDVYMDKYELKDLIGSYENKINTRCPIYNFGN